MQKRYLSEPEQRRLLNAAKSCADPLAQRDYHWMAALVLTGMRIQEFSRLTRQRVVLALACGWLVNRKEDCKGKRRANEYLVTQQLRVHLQALVKLSDESGTGIEPRPRGGQGLVWPSLGEDPDTGIELADGQEQPLVWGRDIAGSAGALSVRGYQLRMKHWAQAAGLDPRLSPHWLRHTRGMNIMRRSRGDNPLKVCQQALNHASLASTGVYLQLSREEYERELQLVDGARVPKRVARELMAGGVA